MSEDCVKKNGASALVSIRRQGRECDDATSPLPELALELGLSSHGIHQMSDDGEAHFRCSPLRGSEPDPPSRTAQKPF